jgi:hypothetical protein
MPVLSHEERQAVRHARLHRWRAAAESGQVPRWQAFRACCQVRKQIHWAGFLSWLRRILPL